MYIYNRKPSGTFNILLSKMMSEQESNRKGLVFNVYTKRSVLHVLQKNSENCLRKFRRKFCRETNVAKNYIFSLNFNVYVNTSVIPKVF